MPIAKVQLPDGRIGRFEVPQGTTPEQVLSFAQNMPKTKEPSAPLNKDIGTQAAAGLLAFGQGGMPVFDELGAGAGALMEKAGIKTLSGQVGQEGDSLGQIYDKRLGNIRGVEKGFNDQHPYLDPALRIAGGVSAAIPFAGALAAAPVKTAAAMGAAQGFTGTNDGLLNRAVGSGVGAGVGAAGGYLANKLVPLVDKLGGAPKNIIKSPEARQISESLQIAGISPDEYAKRLLASSSDDFAGELGGEQLRILTQNKAKLPNPALDTARNAMRERLAQAPTRARGIIQGAFGDDAESQALRQSVEAMRGAETGLYDKVSGNISTKELADVLNRPAGQGAIKDASINLANRYGAGLPEEFVSGRAVPLELPINQSHEIAKALGGQIQRNPLTKEMSDPAQGQPIEAMREMIISKLRAASPEFDAAQTNAANIRQAEDALGLGRKLARMSTGDMADEAMAAALKKESITPFSKEGFKQGLYDSIEGTALGTGNPIAKIAQQKTINRAQDFIGQEAADKFAKDIMVEKLRMELANRSLFGSNTPEAAGELSSQIPFSIRSAAMQAAEKGKKLLNAKSEKRLAEALVSRLPEDKAALAAALLRGGAPARSEKAIYKGISSMVPALPINAYNALMYREQ